jgi:hypothetical protein
MKRIAPMNARRAALQLALKSVLQGTAGAWLAWAHSGVHAQATIPTEVTLDVPQPQAAGTTRLKFLGLSIYDARLWVAPGFQATNFAQYGFALELTYLRSLKGNLIAERSLKEMRRAGNVPAVTEQRWLTAMQDAFPDVKEGDRITGIHLPKLGARFYFNGQLGATVNDVEFSQQFFGIWLSPTTSEPRLRTELLAGYA